MKRPERMRSEFSVISGTTQSIETRRRPADLVIGGLLVAFVIGGLAV
jgi:hypothetical protein